MFVLTLISVILTLPFNVLGAGPDTVRVHASADSLKLYASSDSTKVFASPDSTKLHASTDSLNVYAAADSTLQSALTGSTPQSTPANNTPQSTQTNSTTKSAQTNSTTKSTPADSTTKSTPADTTQTIMPADSVRIYANSASNSSSDSIPDSYSCLPEEEAPEKTITSRPILGISTNIPYDITWIPGYGVTSIPSFSLEYYPRDWKHFTLGADVEWPMWKHWDTHRFMQINNITLWTRRYFRTRACEESARGFYLLANVNAARFGIGFDAARGWQGEGLGASLGAGHRWTWGRFFIDAGLALGYFYARYDPYVWGNDPTGWYYYDYTGDPEDFVPRRMALHWFGPTRVYISIGFDIAKKNRK